MSSILTRNSLCTYSPKITWPEKFLWIKKKKKALALRLRTITATVPAGFEDYELWKTKKNKNDWRIIVAIIRRRRHGNGRFYLTRNDIPINCYYYCACNRNQTHWLRTYRRESVLVALMVVVVVVVKIAERTTVLSSYYRSHAQWGSPCRRENSRANRSKNVLRNVASSQPVDRRWGGRD